MYEEKRVFIIMLIIFSFFIIDESRVNFYGKILKMNLKNEKYKVIISGVGSFYILVIKDDGMVWVCRCNFYGVLGSNVGEYLLLFI